MVGKDENSHNMADESQTPLDRARARFGCDPAAGIDDLRVLADEGTPEAMMILGHAYEDGRGTQKDTTAAKMWYRKAAEHGAVDAFHALGSLFFSEKDYFQAQGSFSEGAVRGDARCAEAESQLRTYEKGEQELAVVRPLITRQKEEPEIVFRELHRLAECGSAYAMLYLGQAYKQGCGTGVDRGRAKSWYRRALDKGSLGVQRYGAYQLGWLFLEEGRYHEARDTFQTGADQGYGPCIHRLADMMRRGQGGARDLPRARALYEQAVDAGQVFALGDLGTLMISGPFGWSARLQGIGLLFQMWRQVCQVAANAGYKDERLWR